MNLNEWVNTYINEISEDENDPQEITVGNYQTKYFHVCPGASSLYKDIESKGVDMDMAERSARLQDALYFIEEHIQRDDYTPDRDYVMVANNIAKNIMKMAEMMGLEKEHDYIQGHVDIIEKVVKEKGLQERVMKLTEENVPTDPSKWSYYKAQAKKKFDVYPSAYANGWASKKYKAAGGGWRKSESVNEETPCWDGYKQVGTKTKNGKEVPNCVPTTEQIKESVMSTLDLLKGESSDLKEFLKKVLSDSDFKDFKNDKEFHKFLKDFYINENMNEDTDIGHTDDEPDMLASDLSVIARYASELEEMMDGLSSKGTEIDLPHWWQTKIIKAKDYLVGAKHYLRAELEDGVTESNDGASAEEEYEFHKKLDTLVHNTFGKRADETKVSEAGMNTSSVNYHNSMKFLKGMKQIPLKTFAKMYMPGNTYVWYDSNSKKFYYVDSRDGDYMELRNQHVLKELHKFLKTQNITLESVNEVITNGDVVIFKKYKGEVPKIKYNSYTNEFSADFLSHTDYYKNLSDAIKDMKNSGFIIDKQIQRESVNESIVFSKQQLDTLRQNYSTINKINPSSPAYTKLIKLLNSLDNKALKQIANADVKFVSTLAKNRIKEGEEIEEYDVETLEELNDFHQFMKEYKSDINEGEYQGRDVELGKIMQGDVKKFKVYVNNDKGNVVKVNFGQKGMTIKKDNPGARKSFRARMNCDNPGPRWKARYWSCRKW